MKTKMTQSTLMKCIAFFLCVCFAFAGLCCAAGAFYLAEDSYYDGANATYEDSAICHRMVRMFNSDAWLSYYVAQLRPETGLIAESRARRLDPANTNYRYAIYNDDAVQVAGTRTQDFDAAVQECTNGYRATEDGQDEYTVLGFVDTQYPIHDVFYEQACLFNVLLAMKYWIIVLGALALLIAAALFVFLMCAAGRYPDAEKPECRNLDRAPFDLYLAVCVGLVFALGFVSVSFTDSLDILAQIALMLMCAALIIAVLIALFMSFGARVKCRCLFRNTIIGWCLRRLWRFIKWCCRGIRTLFTNLPVLWKTLLGVCAFLLLDIILLTSSRHSAFAAILFILLNIAAVVFCCRAALQMRRLEQGAKALASGDFATRLDTKGLYSSFKTHAETLNGIGAGLGRAVEARMKSERMKTDLITNVSHDLKTPLTSIVNYVDLLKKEPLAPPADEYVAVLERQSQRLKKLTEDIVEASKASSGTLNVNLQPTDLGELVRQSMAEYAARFTECGLTPVVTLPEEPLIATADGRLLWRALDNLLANAAKYALPGTRVYIAAAQEGDTARLSVKNVSREPLNIDPGELTERFVRGDASRSAEGSGLGLSIAQSLVSLQHGQLVLSIDGDLFKAEIIL